MTMSLVFVNLCAFYLDIFLVAKYRHGKSSILGLGETARKHL